MRGRITHLTIFLAAGSAHALPAQDMLKPLDPAKARLSYSFPVKSGAPPFRFQVHLNDKGAVTGVSIFRASEERPFQELTACHSYAGSWLREYDQDRELIRHADLDFDGLEDLELLEQYLPHLGKSFYCVYTWDEKHQEYRHSSEIPEIDPVAHPDTRTITVHEDWMGGLYSDSTYRWRGATLQLIEQHGRVYGNKNPGCVAVDYCNRLVQGKMVTTAERAAVCEGSDDPGPLDCPEPQIP